MSVDVWNLPDRVKPVLLCSVDRALFFSPLGVCYVVLTVLQQLFTVETPVMFVVKLIGYN